MTFLAVGFAAGQYTLRAPMASATPQASPVTYRVEAGELGRSIDLRGTVRWSVRTIVYSPAGGVITELAQGPGVLRAGNVVLRLNERPMVIIPSPVPMFRDLRAGDAGRDVQALNAFLSGRGSEVGATVSTFGEATLRAVRAWQQELGLEPTGTVLDGDALLVHSSVLNGPAFRWADGVTIGAPVSAGSPLLEELAPPSLEIALGATPPDGLSEGTVGIAALPDGRSVDVVLGPLVVGESGGLVAAVLGPAGPACEPPSCPLPVAGEPEVSILVRFTIVPQTRGSIVPATAVQTDAAGRPFVTQADGARLPVKVRVAVGGLVVVDGVEPGAEIVLP